MVKLKRRIKKEWKNILFDVLFMLLSILIVIFLFKSILLTSSLLLIVAILGLLKWKSKLSLAIFIIFGILFGIAEVIVSGLGPWNYDSSGLFSAPPWLFLLWGNTAVFIHQMIRQVRKLGIKENKLAE